MKNLFRMAAIVVLLCALGCAPRGILAQGYGSISGRWWPILQGRWYPEPRSRRHKPQPASSSKLSRAVKVPMSFPRWPRLSITSPSRGQALSRTQKTAYRFARTPR